MCVYVSCLAGSFVDGWICCLVGVPVLHVLGIRMVQSKTSVILPGFCVCVFLMNVCMWQWVCGAVCAVCSQCVCVCVCVMFGSVPVWQVVSDVRGVRKCVFMAVG